MLTREKQTGRHRYRFKDTFHYENSGVESNLLITITTTIRIAYLPIL